MDLAACIATWLVLESRGGTDIQWYCFYICVRALEVQLYTEWWTSSAHYRVGSHFAETRERMYQMTCPLDMWEKFSLH